MNTLTPKCYSYLRFSNPKQKKGDSARRQIEAAERYAKDNGLELDKTLNMRDEGLSGFTGKHIKEGNLGKFLALIEAGKIAPGSRLIIESIDRLGRQEPLEAIEVIRLILRAGIVLVVIDWHRVREFTNESIQNNPGEFSGLAAEIERAYFESKKKSERTSESWDQKRIVAENGGKKLTAVCPFWVEAAKDDGDVIDFEEIPEYVRAVRLILKLKSNGYGNRAIAGELNDNSDIPEPPRSKNGWAESTVQRIVHDRRLLGEYQPHTKVDGKREPVKDDNGDEVVFENYYPPVVDEDLFYAVQNRMKKFREKHGHPGGRADKASSVFTHVAHCGKCGSPMHHSHKGSKGKTGGYLRCSLSLQAGRTKNKKSCNARAIYYTHFKEIFFKHVTEIKVSNILPNSSEHQQQIAELTKAIDANGERIFELAEKEDTLMAVIEKDWSPEAHDRLKNQLESIITNRKDLAEHNQNLTDQLRTLEKQGEEMQANLNTLDEVQKLEESAKTEKAAIEIRLKTRTVIKQLVNRIDVFPSDKTTGKFDMVKVWFHGSDPHAHLLRFTNDGWRKLTRMNAP